MTLPNPAPLAVDADPRHKLIQAALQLLTIEPELSKITTRRIAAQAGLAPGLVNYYFHSKEALLNEAVGSAVAAAAQQQIQPASTETGSARQRLHTLLLDTSRMVVQYQRFTRVTISHEILNSQFGVPLTIIPLLREIFGLRYSENELRLIAFQLVIPLQVAYLRAEAFQSYSGISLTNADKIETLIDFWFNCLIPPE
jgi:AcrR family transcriptional regulator